MPKGKAKAIESGVSEAFRSSSPQSGSTGLSAMYAMAHSSQIGEEDGQDEGDLMHSAGTSSSNPLPNSTPGLQTVTASIADANARTASKTLAPKSSGKGKRERGKNKKRLRSSPLQGLTYKLEVVQQPARARMTGFGEKDRRPIDPPVVVKAFVYDSSHYLISPELYDLLPINSLACTAQIFAPDLQTQVGHVFYPTAIQQSSRSAAQAASTSAQAGSSASLPSADVPSTSQNPPTIPQLPALPPLPTYLDPALVSTSEYSYPPIPSTSAPSEADLANSATSFPPINEQPNYVNEPFSDNLLESQYDHTPSEGSSASAGWPIPSSEPNSATISNNTDGQSASSAVPPVLPSEPSAKARNLLGTLTASARILDDESGETGIYFCFSELAVRTEGYFVLSLELHDMTEYLFSS